ncbi:orexin receptor type 2-like [Haliotis asinina]|uniref:orexin receptor type 2-like n=1 Tax=Haliotis asinina TaxID=109174 RepID=UPI003531D286
MNSSHLQHDRDLYLRHLDNEYTLKAWPVILFLSILMLAGFAGNSLVCYVYLSKFKQSALRCYILALATFDLVICVICIPTEIADVRYNYTFGLSKLCMILRFLETCSAFASSTILLAVAVDRNRKICHLFHKQTTPSAAKVIIVVCSITAVIMSLPTVAFYGSRTVMTDVVHVNGSVCTISDDYSSTIYPLIYNGVQFFIFFSSTLSLSVLYGLICRRVVRQGKRMKANKQCNLNIQDEPGTSNIIHSNLSPKSEYNISPCKIKNKPTPTSIAESFKASHGSSDMSSLDMTTVESFKEDNTSLHEGKPTHGPQSSGILLTFGRGKSPGTFKPSHGDKTHQKTTTMMFLITLVFVLSFLPHLGLMVTRAVNKEVFEDLHGVGFIVYNVFLRSYFINSASNPILYSFCSVRFRQELIQLWGRVTIKIKT